MKIFSIALLNCRDFKNPDIVYNVDSFNYFSRGFMKDNLKFACCLVAEKTKEYTRMIVPCKSLENVNFVFPVTIYSLANKDMVSIIIADDEYPCLVIQRLLEKILCQEEKVSDANILKWQNSSLVDKIEKVKNEIHDVKEIMLQNIEQVMNRGEKLEDLMKKSQHLSDVSKLFLKRAKKVNQCCQFY